MEPVALQASGFINAGEFCKFMRKGKGPAGPTWRERNETRNRGLASDVKADLDQRVGKDPEWVGKLARVTPATSDEVRAV